MCVCEIPGGVEVETPYILSVVTSTVNCVCVCVYKYSNGCLCEIPGGVEVQFQ